MNQMGEHKAAVVALFQQRLEEVQAAELVSELGTKKKTFKPRLLILCRSLAASSSIHNSPHTLNMVCIGKNSRLKIKQIFAVSRLVDVSHDGGFDATFNFGASGMLSVSFESHIQREMFVAAVKRLQEKGKNREVDAGSWSRVENEVGGIRGVLTAALGAEVEADAASRVRKLRQEKRRVFSSEEEQHLLQCMGQTSFDDIKGFQKELLKKQKDAELTSLNLLITSAPAWQAVRDQVMDLIQQVSELEGRIEKYSSNLLSKKKVIEQIEHDNNTLCRKQQNLKELFVMMTKLRDQLRLDPATNDLLLRLQRVPDANLVEFFSENTNAHLLSEAMKHMQHISHNPQLDSDYPITAVTERKAYFLEQRRLIACRSRSYIFSTIEAHEKTYLSDHTRYSHNSYLVWRLHSELSDKLLVIRDIICSLYRIDAEGFTSTLRKYRTSMQKVYHAEVHRFFKVLRKQIKKVNTWRGPFLLGSSERRGDIFVARTQAAETPRIWNGSQAPSPALTPRALLGYDDDPRSRKSSEPSCIGESDNHTLTIDFPSITMFRDIELYTDPGTLRRLAARAAPLSVESGVKSLSTLADNYNNGANGHVRPDLAFAIALESAVACILYEESVLSTCFGLAEKTSAASGPQPAELCSDSFNSTEGRGPRSSFTLDHSERSAHVDKRGASSDAAQAQREKTELLMESLLELFGGDALVDAMGSPVTPGLMTPTASRNDKLFEKAPGLPPRYPSSSLQYSFFSFNGPKQSTFLPTEGSFGAPGSQGDDDDDVLAFLSPRATQMIRSNFLVREMVSLTKFLAEKCDRIYSLPALCMIRAYRRNRKMRTTRSSFCQAMLRDLEAVTASAMMRFVAEQTESINVCRRRYNIRPMALLHCFVKMPALIMRMEEVHNYLAPGVCDRTEYASIVLSLISQSFDVLDSITNVESSCGEAAPCTKLKLGELIEKKIFFALEGTHADIHSLKVGFIQQYRHHAFFCAFYNTLLADSYAADLLREHYDFSKTKRDRYEKLYLTQILLLKEFPVFGGFTLAAEDLSEVYSQEELRHHRTLALDAVKKVIEKFEKEFRSGIRSSAARMKKHFLRLVDLAGNEESFHRTLLQRTWEHFSRMFLQKYDFMEGLLSRPTYQGMSMPVTRQEVAMILSGF